MEEIELGASESTWGSVDETKETRNGGTHRKPKQDETWEGFKLDSLAKLYYR